MVSSVYASLDLAKDGDASLAEPVIEYAANIGAGFIMPIPRLYTAEDAVTIARERDNIAAAMQKLVSMAAQANLRVTIEDFDSKGSPILNSDGMLYFLKAAPGLTAAFDTGNFRYACEDTLSAFTALAPYIAHAHLKDRALNAPELGNPTTALDGAMLYPSAVGDGIVPIREILQKLQGIGYQGALTVEHFAHTDPFGAIRRSATFVKNCVTIED